MNTAPLRIIKIHTVVATFGPPIRAAKAWMKVATGP